MHIVTVDAMSINGKITKGSDAPAHSWTSPEDWQHFQTLRDSFDLIVMGSRTYEMVRPEPEAARLRVVLTSKPEAYTARTVPGQLEFWDATPADLVKGMEKRGFSRLLLVGGRVNTQFWAAGLVDEAYITVEPFVFGAGKSLAAGVNLEARLRLQSLRQLNKRGTVLLHYLVDRQK